MLKLYMAVQTLKATLGDRVRDEDAGGVAIEYALLAALIAVAFIGGATLLGTQIEALFQHIQGLLGVGG